MRKNFLWHGNNEPAIFTNKSWKKLTTTRDSVSILRTYYCCVLLWRWMRLRYNIFNLIAAPPAVIRTFFIIFIYNYAVYLASIYFAIQCDSNSIQNIAVETWLCIVRAYMIRFAWRRKEWDPDTNKNNELFVIMGSRVFFIYAPFIKIWN